MSEKFMSAEAHEIERRAIELAEAICDASTSVERACKLLHLASCLLQLHTRAGVMSPLFQKRIEQHRKAVAELQAFDADAQLVDQLGTLGIDHEPIFADRTAGGE